MAVGIVERVEFNVTKPKKSGGSFTCNYVHWTTESGQKRSDKVFDKADFIAVVRDLAPGDKIEGKIVKSGDFFNLEGVVVLEKGTGSFSAPVRTFGGKSMAHPPEFEIQKQKSIEKQVCLKGAIDITCTMIDKDLIKKVNTEQAGGVVIQLASQLEFYLQGKVDPSPLEEPSLDPPFNVTE